MIYFYDLVFSQFRIREISNNVGPFSFIIRMCSLATGMFLDMLYKRYSLLCRIKSCTVYNNFISLWFANTNKTMKIKLRWNYHHIEGFFAWRSFYDFDMIHVKVNVLSLFMLSQYFDIKRIINFSNWHFPQIARFEILQFDIIALN